jgi:two-component system phosphate regulon sensor histidine kinase PhoR
VRLRADQQLFLAYLLLILVLVGSVSVAASAFMRGRLTDASERHLRRELRIAAALYDASPGQAPDSFAVWLGALSGRRVTVVGRDGEVLGESTRTGGSPVGMPNQENRPEIRAVLAGPDSVRAAVRHGDADAAEHMYAATVTGRGDVLRISLPLAEIDAALAAVQRRILSMGAVAVLLTILFSLGFSLLVTRPVRRIQAVAAALAAGDLTRRLREYRGDDLGDLARSLDALADELQNRLGQLDAERTEMQTLIDSMSEGVLAITPAGTLRRANPAARRMFRLAGHAQGMPPEAVARRPEFLGMVTRALAGEPSSLTELTSDGRSLLGTAHPLPDGGAVLVFLDVSELRRLEDVRRDFVANASHELKTPLTAIRGYSETLLDPDLAPELARQFANVVRQNAERLQRIVDDLLDLSRIESGGWRVQPEKVDVEAAAAAAWPSRDGEERGTTLETAIEPDAEQVHADPQALHQIFANLFGNAIRHTPPGGTVTVRGRPAPRAARRMVELEVRDTGSGIPAADLPRIFERFYRADPARSRAEGGTGLGLAIVKHLVEAHGGEVRAESRIGQGTAIRFTLPAIER